MFIGRNIRVYRSMLGVNQEALAKSAKISPKYLSYIENGKKEPSLSVLKQISSALDVPLVMLFIEDEDFGEQPNMDNPTMKTMNRLLMELLLKLRIDSSKKSVTRSGANVGRIKEVLPAATVAAKGKKAASNGRRSSGAAMKLSDHGK